MKTNKILNLFIALVIGFFVLQYVSSFFMDSKNEEVKDEELSEILQNNPFLVDVRTPQEFAAGTVPGAINIPLDEVEKRVSEFQGKKEIVVFCRTGNRSGQAKRILEAKGIENITNGGSWQNVNKNSNPN